MQGRFPLNVNLDQPSDLADDYLALAVNMNNMFGTVSSWSTGGRYGSVIAQHHDVPSTYWEYEDRKLISSDEFALYQAMQNMYRRQRNVKLTMIYRPARGRPRYQSMFYATEPGAVPNGVSTEYGEDPPLYLRQKANGCEVNIESMTEQGYLAAQNATRRRSVFRPWKVVLKPKRPPYNQKYGNPASSIVTNPDYGNFPSGQWISTDMTTSGTYQPQNFDHFQLFMNQPPPPYTGLHGWNSVGPINRTGENQGWFLGWVHFWITIQFAERKANITPS